MKLKSRALRAVVGLATVACIGLVSVGAASVEEGCTPAQFAEAVTLTEAEVNCVVAHYGEPAAVIVLTCLGSSPPAAKKKAALALADSVAKKVSAEKSAAHCAP